jgi:hypothetical protein
VDGSYNLSLLTPGNWSVKFEAMGFQTVDVPSVTITVTETGALNRVLTVGSQTQITTVEADVETVQTTNAAVGAVMNSAAVVDLPLTTRNYQNLIGFSPGANASVPDATSLGKGTVTTAVNGATNTQNNFMLDGVSVNNYLSFGTGHELNFYGSQGIPNPDSIAEFKIQTSTYDAGYGRNPGANVNVVTKAGTNDFHGTAFEFFRNTVLNANTWFLNLAGKPRGALNQNQYGGAFGGPVKKDKLFFFVSYQETAQKNGLSSAGLSSFFAPPIPTGNRGTCPVGWTVLTQCDAAAQAFVPALGAAVCPANNTNTGPGGTPNPFDQITTAGSITVACDGSDINPVAVKILQLKLANGSYYVPSSGSAHSYLQQTYSFPARYEEHQGMGNWDYVINQKNTLSGRYFFGLDPAEGAFPVNCTPNCVPGQGVQFAYTNHEALLRLTTIVTNNLVNEARMSYQRNVSQLGTTGTFKATDVGITSLASNLPYLPLIGMTGVLTLGTQGFNLYYEAVNQFQWADQLSWTHGKHSIRFGGEVERVQADNEVVGLAVGQPLFGSFPDFLIGRCGAVAGCALSNGAASSNIVTPGTTTNAVALGGEWPHYYRLTDVTAFIQDDFKVNSHLTVNLGVRWEYDGNPSDINGAFSSINPGLVQANGIPGTSFATGTLTGFIVPHNYNAVLPAGVVRSQVKVGSLNTPPLDNFAPRVGLAWQPLSSSKLVLRAGAGYFYDRSVFSFQQVLYNSQPYEISPTPSPLATLATPFVLPPNIPAPPGIGFTPRWVNFGVFGSGLATNDPNITNVGNSAIANPSIAPRWDTPTQYEWNADAQYEFARDWVLQVGYVGSRGIHEPLSNASIYYNVAPLASAANPLHCGFDGNPAHCITASTAKNAPNRVPNLGISSQATLSATTGDYKFNSLQVSVRKTLSHGLQLQAAYSYSRSFISELFGVPSLSTGSTVCCVGPKYIYGINPAYRPNRFIVNYHYELPFGHPMGVVGKIAEGWSVSGVTTIQGGAPLNLTDSTGGAAYGLAGPAISWPQYCGGAGPSNIATHGSTDSRVLGVWLNGRTQGVFCNIPNAAGVAPAGAAGTVFGNAGTLGTVLSPGQNSWDMSLAKLTKVGGIREDATLEFRTEFFNAFNHPQFGNPVTNASSGSFGKITTTVVNPRLIQFALKYSF